MRYIMLEVMCTCIYSCTTLVHIAPQADDQISVKFPNGNLTIPISFPSRKLNLAFQ